jgi:ubiquinone biosynthesis protein
MRLPDVPSPTRRLGRQLRLARLLLRHRALWTGNDRAGDDGAPEALAAELEALGPTFVKLGQVLSTRPDLVPERYAQALERLQDRLEPVPFAAVEATVRSELGVRIGKAFARFDPQPLASASLGQVHRAALRDGRPVAVKVQRPGVAARVAADLDAIDGIAAVLDRRTEAGRRLRLRQLLADFRRTMEAELDYELEARNLERLADQLSGFDRIVVPLPVADYTSRRVLTMDFVRGRKVTDVGPLGRIDLDGEALADALLRAYLEQILVHGFFHADPHPGNVFVTDHGDLALLDLGMVARVPPEAQDLLLKLVLALAEARGEDAAAHALALAEERPGADPAAFRRDVTALVLRHEGATGGDLRTGRLALELSALMARAGYGIPRELTLLGKTLVQLDQICRTLAPELDPNSATRRHAAELTRARLARWMAPGNAMSGLLELKQLADRLPSRINRILEAAAEDRLTLRVAAAHEARWIEALHAVANRITSGLLLAALIVGAALLMRVETSFRVLGYPGLAMLGFLAAAAGGLALLVSARK